MNCPNKMRTIAQKGKPSDKDINLCRFPENDCIVNWTKDFARHIVRINS